MELTVHYIDEDTLSETFELSSNTDGEYIADGFLHLTLVNGKEIRINTDEIFKIES